MKHKSRSAVRLAVLRVITLAGLTVPVSAATFEVTTTADTNDGACDTHCSLREAIVAANSDPDRDTITLPAGTYRLSIPGRNEDHGVTGDLDILERVDIRGASEETTVINGGAIDRVLHVHIMEWHEGDEPVEVFDVTITGGDVANGSSGGGVLNRGALVMKRCTIAENTAHGYDASGGGIANTGTLALESVTVADNSTDGGVGDGGGVWNSYGTLSLGDSKIRGNTSAGDGAGLWSGFGTVSMTRVTVSGNTSVADHADGGGIWAGYSTFTLSACTVSSNTITGDSGGGGIWAENSTVAMANCTISGNLVKDNGDGGGLWTDHSTVTMTNCTFSDNSVPGGQGNAIRTNSGIVTLKNTLVAGDCRIGLGTVSGGGNLESPGNSCGFSHPGDRPGVSPASLALGGLADNGGPTLTHALLADSAALDTGVRNGCPSNDQRGEPRPRDGDGDGDSACDIGAYEAGTEPSDGYSYAYWVPVAAHLDGANGSKWRTTVGTFNRSPSQAELELVLRTHNASFAVTAAVAGSGQGMFHDVAAQLGIDNDKGTLEIRSDRPLIVTSRTYNQSAEGTFGQYLGGTTADEGLRSGERGTLPQLTQSAAYRCNLGFANLGSAAAAVEVVLYDGGGSEVGALSVVLDPGRLHQEDRIYERVAGRGDIDGGYATITVTSGSGVVAYGSVIDNGTGDATTIPMWR
jgi:CSLREA domain-containing protein